MKVPRGSLPLDVPSMLVEQNVLSIVEVLSRQRGRIVHQHRLAGAWNHIKGQAKQEWGKLPEDDFPEIELHRDRFVHLLQERYGATRTEADHQINQWLRCPAQARS